MIAENTQMFGNRRAFDGDYKERYARIRPIYCVLYSSIATHGVDKPVCVGEMSRSKQSQSWGGKTKAGIVVDRLSSMIIRVHFLILVTESGARWLPVAGRRYYSTIIATYQPHSYSYNYTSKYKDSPCYI